MTAVHFFPRLGLFALLFEGFPQPKASYLTFYNPFGYFPPTFVNLFVFGFFLCHPISFLPHSLILTSSLFYLLLSHPFYPILSSFSFLSPTLPFLTSVPLFRPSFRFSPPLSSLFPFFAPSLPCLTHPCIALPSLYPPFPLVLSSLFLVLSFYLPLPSPSPPSPISPPFFLLPPFFYCRFPFCPLFCCSFPFFCSTERFQFSVPQL